LCATSKSECSVCLPGYKLLSGNCLQENDEDKVSVGLIVGVCVGAVLLIGIVVLLIVLLVVKPRKNDNKNIDMDNFDGDEKKQDSN